MATINTRGRLGNKPREVQAKVEMTTASIAVSVPCRSEANGEASVWIDVVAFGKVAKALRECQKGDMIGVLGTLQLNRWNGKDTWQVVVESLMSVRRANLATQDAKPGKGTTERQANSDTPPGFDDDMTFGDADYLAG